MFKNLITFLSGVGEKNKQTTQDLKRYIADKRFTEAGGVSPIPPAENPVPPLQKTPILQKLS